MSGDCEKLSLKSSVKCGNQLLDNMLLPKTQANMALTGDNFARCFTISSLREYRGASTGTGNGTVECVRPSCVEREFVSGRLRISGILAHPWLECGGNTGGTQADIISCTKSEDIISAICAAASVLPLSNTKRVRSWKFKK